MVSVLAGPPAPYSVRVTDGDPQLAPSCQGPTGSATPGVRLKELADAFGARGQFTSVCDGDLSAPLARLGDAIIKQLGAACLLARPAKLEGEPDCRVSERAAGLGPEVAVPACRLGGPRPCWKLGNNAEQCASGLELKLEHTGAVLPGTVATALCRVCTDPKDARCK
jgi:hypothetical protein